MGPPIVGVLACYTGLAEKQCGGKRGVEPGAHFRGASEQRLSSERGDGSTGVA